MKIVELTCRCGAQLRYRDVAWRVDVAVEEWEDQHRRCEVPPAPVEEDFFDMGDP